MALRVYLAGKYEERFALRRVRERLEREFDVRVCSSWLDDSRTREETTEALGALSSQEDLRDLQGCACIILDTQAESRTGGREVEWGYALGTYKMLWRVGPVRNIFHTATQWAFSTWEELYAALATTIYRKDMGATSGEIHGKESHNHEPIARNRPRRRAAHSQHSDGVDAPGRGSTDPE